VRLTNGSAAKIVDYTYEPYGKASADTASTNAFQYTGRENDGAGLNYYRARYQHPVLGRFVSEDPIGLRGGDNVYAYVGGVPTLYSDPTGELVWLAGTAAIGAAIGALTNMASTILDPCWNGSLGTLALNGAIGAGTGALAGVALGTGIPGIASGALAGGGIGAINGIATGIAGGNLNWSSVGMQAGIGAVTGSLGGMIGSIGTLGALPAVGVRPMLGQATAAVSAGNQTATAAAGLYSTIANATVPQNLGGFAYPSAPISCGCP